MSIEDDLADVVRIIRKFDRFDLVDEALDRLMSLRERVHELIEENRRLRRKLEALRARQESVPYEGVYWFDAGGTA